LVGESNTAKKFKGVALMPLHRKIAILIASIGGLAIFMSIRSAWLPAFNDQELAAKIISSGILSFGFIMVSVSVIFEAVWTQISARRGIL